MPKQRTGISREELANEFRKQAEGNGWGVSPCCFPEKIEGEFFPDRKDLFRAFTLVRPDEVKYVILGQDPYFSRRKDGSGTGIATGVAFGVCPNDVTAKAIDQRCAIFRVLDGIYGEGKGLSYSSLEGWARDKKILLLNAALTVPREWEGKNGRECAGKHLKYKYWTCFVKEILLKLHESPKVKFIAWGREPEKLLSKLLSKPQGSCNRIVISYHPTASKRKSDKMSFCNFWRQTEIGKELRCW